MSPTQHQLIQQCATRLRGIVEALDNIHDTSPHRWSTDLDEVHSSAESLLALIKDQAPPSEDQLIAAGLSYPLAKEDAVKLWYSGFRSEVITVLEAWEAIGHDTGINPDKEELLESLRNMAAICNAHGNDMPAQSVIDQRQVIADAITGALAFGAQASQPPAEDHWLRPFYDIGRAEGQRTLELAMLVRMLASSLKRHAPESNLVARATNYLAAKGLVGTPLRDAPASVEQAGGDEREEFEAWMHTFDLPPQLDGETFADERYLEAACFGQFVYDDPLTQRCWAAWQARAALAQPSPAQTQPSPAPTLRAAIDVANDRFEVPVAKWGTDLVGEEERPEVAEVAFVLRNIGAMDAEDIDGDNVDLRFEDAEGRETGCDVSIVEYAEKAADLFEQHDRIVGELRADRDSWAEQAEQRLADWDEMRKERDAALARVAELERQEPVALANRGLHAFWVKWTEAAAGLYGPGIKLYAAPVALAQHSVPDGFREKFKQCMELAFAEIAYYVSPEKARDPNSRARKASALATELLDMLAGAPGTEVPQAWLDVQAERRRQVTAEGWTPEHDDAHSHGQMARAAACYALAGSSAPNDGTAALLVSLAWPWDEQWWKPTTTRRDLVKACALGLAEIERLDRAGISQNPQPGATTASS
ncbi:hypothetical protein MP294_002834 [Pseudomonas aeruginosa]